MTVLAALDPESDSTIAGALMFTGLFRAGLTLLSVSERRLQRSWSLRSMRDAHPALDIDRVVLPGNPPEVIARYADQIRADVILLSAGYAVRNWLWRRRQVVSDLAPLTSRPIGILPAQTAWSPVSPLRVACLIRSDHEEDHLRFIAQDFVRRCGGELSWLDSMEDRNIDLLIASRPIYARSGTIAAQLPYPLLSIPLSSGASGRLPTLDRRTASA